MGIKKTEDYHSTNYWLGVLRHRPNGPARVWANGYAAWWLFDRYHRYYGPQDSVSEWWIHGKWIKFN